MNSSDTVCILCGNNNAATQLYASTVSSDHMNAAVFSARRLPDRIHETILRCKKCGLVYPTKLIDPSTLSHLYEKSVYTYGDEESFIRRTYQRYLKRVLTILSHQTRPLSYLDIGCGNGFMLGAAKEIGFDDVWGVEPSLHAIEKADDAYRRQIVQGMFSADLFPDKRFDAISCFQTLDHIPDPVGFVRSCLALLKPGGCVLFINHNIASLTARILGERCPMIDIEHTYLHTPATMRQLFGNEGYGDIEVFSVRNDYPVHYWFHLVPGPRKIKEPILAWLKKSKLGSIVLRLYPGNLGLIARKK